MRTMIVYESMFGNTRKVAEAIGAGLAQFGDVAIVNVNDAGAVPEGVDLLLVGAPTHVHGLSREATRAEAENWTKDPAKHLTLEPKAPGIGVRDWLDTLAVVPRFVGAFDTRADIAALLSGEASAKIQRELIALGGHKELDRESFVLDGQEVVSGELERAKSWGQRLGAAVADKAGQNAL